jgi:hypothetical protein
VIVMKNESGSAEHGCGSALLDPPLPDDPFAADEEAFWEQRGFTPVPAAQTGRMTVQRALGADPGPVLARCLAALDPTVLDRAVQARVLATAPEQTLAEMKAALRRAVIAADPAGAAHRAEQARAGRTLSRDPSTTGWPSCAPCSPPPTPSWSGPS